MKQVNSRTFGLLVLVCLTSAACQYRQTQDATDQDENALYGDYKVSYDANNKKLDLFAQLRRSGPNGESIRLDGSSKITSSIGNSEIEFQVFDGERHVFTNLNGTYYTSGIEGVEPQSDYPFLWTRTNGKTFENKVHLGEALQVVTPLPGALHQAGNDLVVTFYPAVGPNEEVECTLNIDNSFLKIKTSAMERATTCTFDKGPLIPAFERDSTIEISRKMTLNRPQSGHDVVGGSLESVFKAKTVSIKIVN